MIDHGNVAVFGLVGVASQDDDGTAAQVDRLVDGVTLASGILDDPILQVETAGLHVADFEPLAIGIGYLGRVLHDFGNYDVPLVVVSRIDLAIGGAVDFVFTKGLVAEVVAAAGGAVLGATVASLVRSAFTIRATSLGLAGVDDVVAVGILVGRHSGLRMLEDDEH